ncbi:MAG: Mu transposase C-terminal domain-containing protein [Arenicellales bacterium]
MALPTPINKQLAPAQLDAELSDWEKLPKAKRDKAQKRAAVVLPIMLLMEEGSFTLSRAVESMLLDVRHSSEGDFTKAAIALGRNGNPPSRASLINWCQAYQKHGLMGLVAGHKGKEREVRGWEAAAMRYYQMPSKPSFNAVSEWLQADGYESATYPRIRSYLKSLPAEHLMKGRLGPRLIENTKKTFTRRDTSGLQPGDVYQGDGYTLDIYLKHPTGNRPWRAELTLWLDVACRYIVGWYISDAESAHSTLFSLSHALLSHDHIPSCLHIDNGSGFKNKMMSNECTGFYDKWGISIMHSRPYNAKGKGHVERIFGTIKGKFLKKFPGYCGHDMDNEAQQLYLKKCKAGDEELMSRDTFVDEFSNWIDVYHATPHGGLDGKTPASQWEGLVNTPVAPKSAALFWPRSRRVVSRQCIRLDNREYVNKDLLSYDKKSLIAEYSIHDDSYIRVLDDKERWICDATLVKKADYLPASRIDENNRKKSIAATRRLQSHIQEVEDRAHLAITHDQANDGIAEILPDAPARQVAQAEKETGIDFSTPEFEPVQTPSSSKDDWDPNDYI